MPASRLMAKACNVSSTTAPISKISCQGCVKRPSETIRVVAPAGGCGDAQEHHHSSRQPQRECSSDDARSTSLRTANAGPAIVNPVTTRLK